VRERNCGAPRGARQNDQDFAASGIVAGCTRASSAIALLNSTWTAARETCGRKAPIIE